MKPQSVRKGSLLAEIWQKPPGLDRCLHCRDETAQAVRGLGSAFLRSALRLTGSMCLAMVEA